MFAEDFASSKLKRIQSESKQEVKEAKKKENKSNCENKVPQHRYTFYSRVYSALISVFHLSSLKAVPS